MRDLESEQQRKQNKQMAKIRPLQTTQLQVVVLHFLTKKYSTLVLQGLIYICRKAPPKSSSSPKACDKIQIKNKNKRKSRKTS